MLNVEDIVSDSYERLQFLGKTGRYKTSEIFLNKFYEKFISASPIVREKFKNTDMNKQKRQLQESLYYMLQFYMIKKPTDYMRGIANRHSKKALNISPQLYDLWLESLVATVRELDPKYDQDVGLAWKMVMSTGIKFMKNNYDSK